MESSFFRFVDAKPLGAGLIALLIGIVAGLAVPGTETENELMGSARDRILDRAKDAATDIQQKAKETAKDMLEGVQDRRRASVS